jgi:hypothetical protein
MAAREAKRVLASRAQFVFGTNLVAIGLGLPLAWNFVVASKWEEWRASKKEVISPHVLRAEEAAIEILVDERRAERGLPPYFGIKLEPAAHALFEQVRNMDQQRRAQEADKLRLSPDSLSASLPSYGLPVSVNPFASTGAVPADPKCAC